jgi:hypothetical protein
MKKEMPRKKNNYDHSGLDVVGGIKGYVTSLDDDNREGPTMMYPMSLCSLLENQKALLPSTLRC